MPIRKAAATFTSGDIGSGDAAPGPDVTGADVTGRDATGDEKISNGADASEVVNQDVGSDDARSQDARGENVTPADACTPASATEDCTNGIDDNCDGKIDCADPQCGAYACAAPVPAGWSTPASLWQGANPAGRLAARRILAAPSMRALV